MKLVRPFMILVLSVVVFCACQKEIDFETIITDSVGTLKSADSTFDCLPSTVSGEYKIDSVLGSGNYIDVQIDALTPGVYTIFSDTVNGYSFRGSGNIGTSGLNTVRIYGSGTPILPGDDTFVITFGSSFCFIDVPVADTTAEATYTLGGNGGSCTGQLPSGTFTAGVAMADTNTVQISLEVLTPGLYNISTTTVNDVSFSAEGNFTTTGVQTVTLIANPGTPAAAGTFNYPVLGSTSSCAFAITYQ